MTTVVAHRATLAPMRWWDVADVAAVEQQVFVGGPPWSAAQLWAELAGVPQVRHYLVARADGVLLGYAGMSVGPDAAEVIHSDLKKGFIRAEVVSYDDLVAAGSHKEAKRKGAVRLEGKSYEVRDGDVIEFRFNV